MYKQFNKPSTRFALISSDYKTGALLLCKPGYISIIKVFFYCDKYVI